MIADAAWLKSQLAAGSSVADIAIKVGKGKSTIYTWLRVLGIELPSRDLPAGTEFGSLSVISRVGTQDGEAIYLCRCRCGKTKRARRSNLVGGGTSSCGCQQYLKGSKHPLFKGHELISGKYWRSLVTNANSRGIVFNVTISQAWQLYEEQRRVCALSGLPIVFSRQRLQTASLDRIDSNGGYILPNVQWVHKEINRMKMHLSEERFVELCRRVVNCSDDLA